MSEGQAAGAAGAPEGRVSLAPGTPEAGLAAMLAELIRRNIALDPKKEADFLRLAATICIEAADAEVLATLAFSRGTLVVAAGDHLRPDVIIRTDSQTILDLAMIRISRGVPQLLNADGRRLVRKLRAGELRISGLLRHPVQLVRLTRLLSVNG